MRHSVSPRRLTITWLLALGLGLAAIGPWTASAAAASCPGADAPAISAPVGVMRSAVLCLVNQEREARGLPALHASKRLNRSAQHWTDVMVRTRTFSHGTNFSGRIGATGYVWSTAGENIATGFQTPREVMRGWMASQGHCVNILNPTFSDLGTGVDSVSLGSFAPSTWTQDFALWMGHRARSQNYGPANGCPYNS
jgi:uncharacterized protein YkwD